MEAHKLTSLAGTLTMVVFGAAHYAEPLVMVQAGTQPQPGRSEQPSTRPGVPAQPVERFPRTNQPNQPTTQNPSNPATQPPPANPNPPGTVTPGAPGAVVPGTGNGRFFAFQNPAMEAQFNQVSGQLLTLEQQLIENNKRLLMQLGQARQMTGERKIDAIAEVMQGDLQQEGAMLQYLMDLRATITGQMANQTGTPGTNNPNTPVTNPGTLPTTNNPPRNTNPNAPANNPQPPR